MRILLTDDHAIVRHGLKQILQAEFPAAEFGEASDVPTTLDLANREHWDLLVLDITLGGRSGLEALKDIKQTRPRLPVLVLSMHPEDQFGVRVLKTGASGYLTKEAAPEELVNAVNKILSGRRYVSPTLAEAMATYLSGDSQKPAHETLSDREFLVLRLISSGLPVSAIAKELNLSVKTISTYRARILLKMGLRNNAELTHYAISNRLV
ncbi:MAG: DNA-binding response regulator [Opitutus sp.]|nr:DNA-binding response regulator [Opitutus sp.]